MSTAPTQIEYCENSKEKFRACYPNWLHHYIMEDTEDTVDYLVYEHVVNEAWRHRTDIAEINTKELAMHYELAKRTVLAELRKLTESGKLILKDDRMEHPVLEFQVPLITDLINQYKKYGVKFT